MKIKAIKQIAISLLAVAALHGSSFAGPAAWTNRKAPRAPGMPENKTMHRYQHAMIKTPYQSAGQPAASYQFNAGENSFSVGDDWFRD